MAFGDCKGFSSGVAERAVPNGGAIPAPWLKGGHHTVTDPIRSVAKMTRAVVELTGRLYWRH